MELHIGIDDEKAVVSPYRIMLRRGRARRRRTATVTEMLPLAPSGRSREVRITRTARVALPVMFVAAALFGAGLPWWLPAVAGSLLIGAFWRREARAAEPTSFAEPAPGRGTVLWSSPERTLFAEAVAAAQDARRHLPAMVDAASADRELAHALAELAGVLSRRQEIRRVRATLSTVRPHDVPKDSPALRALTEQREHADVLFAEAGEQAGRILAGITGTARSGEVFHREQLIGAVARDAEHALAGLAAAAVTPPRSELADRTEAVVTAYRDLSAS